MGIEKRGEAQAWFDFFNILQKEPVDVWAEDLYKVFNLINRYRPEEIICKKICGIPTIFFIHSTKRGPALGGTRARPTYLNTANFFRDGLKLSYAMTYKAIWARLPLGGGKAVIYATPQEVCTDEFTQGYGKALNEINAERLKFITGEDVGCGEEFIDKVAKCTTCITGKSVGAGGLGDPSPRTAEGCFLAIKAIVEEADIFSGTLQGKIVAVQGAGKVALPLIKMLLEAGVRVYFSENDGDPVAEIAAQKAQSAGAVRVPKDAILSVPCHIFMPVAIGGVINKNTVARLSSMCRIVIGAANNILDTPEDGVELHHRRIFYAPDYVVNRWGLEWVAQEKNGVTDPVEARKNLTDITKDILNICRVSVENNIAPSEIADLISKQVLNDEVASIEEAFNQLKNS